MANTHSAMGEQQDVGLILLACRPVRSPTSFGDAAARVSLFATRRLIAAAQRNRIGRSVSQKSTMRDSSASFFA